MTDAPKGPDAGRFNLSALFCAPDARDHEFWRLHAAWREAEDDFEAGPFDGDDPEGEALLDIATELRDAMFGQGVFSAMALLAKLEAVRDGGPSSLMDMKLPSGFTVFDVIRFDVERLAKAELIVPEAGA